MQIVFCLGLGSFGFLAGYVLGVAGPLKTWWYVALAVAAICLLTGGIGLVVETL